MGEPSLERYDRSRLQKPGKDASEEEKEAYRRYQKERRQYEQDKQRTRSIGARRRMHQMRAADEGMVFESIEAQEAWTDEQMAKEEEGLDAEQRASLYPRRFNGRRRR